MHNVSDNNGLRKEALDEFMTICREDLKEVLPPDEALSLALDLLDFYEILFPASPVPPASISYPPPPD